MSAGMGIMEVKIIGNAILAQAGPLVTQISSNAYYQLNAKKAITQIY